MGDWLSRNLDVMVAAQLKHHFTKLPPIHRPFITISREFGCDGNPLGEALIKRLQDLNSDKEHPWRLFGKTNLIEAMDMLELEPKTLEMLEQFGHSSFESYIQEQVFGQPNQLETIKKVGQLLRLMAMRGHVILLGSGAPVLTKGIKGGIHVRLYASESWRIEHHAQRWNIEIGEAQKVVTESQEKREGFVKTFLAQDIADPSHYHLMINNARVSVPQIADMIVRMVTGH